MKYLSSPLFLEFDLVVLHPGGEGLVGFMEVLDIVSSPVPPPQLDDTDLSPEGRQNIRTSQYELANFPPRQTRKPPQAQDCHSFVLTHFCRSFPGLNETRIRAPYSFFRFTGAIIILFGFQFEHCMCPV